MSSPSNPGLTRPRERHGVSVSFRGILVEVAPLVAVKVRVKVPVCGVGVGVGVGVGSGVAPPPAHAAMPSIKKEATMQ